jgi:hypothetical protein
MRVGVIQSNYLPWRGYFDFVDDVDLFIVYDDVQFSKGSWRNRNRVKTARGLEWMTVPVRHDFLGQRICDTQIDGSRNWQQHHRALVARSLSGTSYFDDVMALLEPEFDAGHRTISELNVALLRSTCAYLGVDTPIRLSSEFSVAGTRTGRLIRLLTAVGATTYLSGPSARAYLDAERFRQAGIALEYKQYDYAPYPQLWGAFEGAVSIIDTIANCGPAAREVLKSGDAVLVPAPVPVAKEWIAA